MGGNMNFLAAKSRSGLLLTPALENICSRALYYLDAGHALHLYGPPGSGKTTMSAYIAALRGNPVTLIYGSERLATAELACDSKEALLQKVMDNFVRPFHCPWERVRTQRADKRIKTACKNGYTLVYDDFSRSSTEDNELLFSILEERMQAPFSDNGCSSSIQIHPDFRVIFTSSSREETEAHRPPDSLMARMVSIRLDGYDRETAIAITAFRSGVTLGDAAKIVDIIGEYSIIKNNYLSSLKASIIIASIAASHAAKVSKDDLVFFETCADVLDASGSGNGEEKGEVLQLMEVISKHCEPRTQK